MTTFVTKIKNPDAHLLFPVVHNRKIKISVGEVIGVRLYEGRSIMGIVDEISKDKEHFWLRTDPSPNSRRERFSLKIDQIIKLS